MAKATKSKNINNLTGIGRQIAFLELQKETAATDDSFFVTDKVMESMRDNGYRDIRKALNDLVDNSEQAGAKKIAVLTTSGKDGQKNSKERITNIAIIDDGHGMYPDMLPVAIKWGGTDRHNQRDGLGRFGFGLPTASISVTKSYDVYSKTLGSEWHKITVDLNEITSAALSNGGKVAFTPIVVKDKLPDYIREYIKRIWKKDDLEQGTVILLREPDRIRRFSQPQKFQAKMLQNIGLTYRHFMPAISFFVNEQRVEMIDPLFLNPNCLGYENVNGIKAEGVDEIVIPVRNTLVEGEVKEGNVKLRFSFMHPKFQRDNTVKETKTLFETKAKGDAKGQIIQNRWNTMKENNGYFIVCRSGRQIDVVRETDYQSDSDNITLVNYDANWAVELSFDPALDEMFGITTNKQQVEIDSYLWDIFKDRNIPGIVAGFRAKTKALLAKEEANQDVKNNENRDSEQIMTESERIDKTDVPLEKQIIADDKLKVEAKAQAEKNKEDEEIVFQKIVDEIEKRKYKIEFTDYPGAPFYSIELWGTQIKLKLNIAHPFYTDIYTQQETRGRTALELLLFVLAKCESEARDDKLLFYQNERFEWSRKLDLRLKILDRKDPIIDKLSFQSEDE
jgi:hypothetical protein